MKKLMLHVLAAVLITLQSCSVNTDVTLHKDTTSSLQMDAEFKEMLTMIRQQAGSEENTKSLEKIPRVWTSFYDMEMKEGSKIKNVDSIRLMKKMFVKSNYVVNEMSGISFRMDRFTKEDYQALEKMQQHNTEDKLPVNNKVAMNWDGKKLVLNTRDFSTKAISDMLSKGQSDGTDEADPEQTKQMMQMMMKKMVTTLKFESDIKSVTGKHDWVKQLDKRSIRIEYDVTNLEMDKSLTNNDPQITIITE